jgi:hypothetical protein
MVDVIDPMIGLRAEADPGNASRASAKTATNADVSWVGQL